MHILRLTPFYQHENVQSWPREFDPVGGMQVQIAQMSRWLAANGVEQTIFTLGFPGVPRLYYERENLVIKRAYLPMPHVKSELTGLVGLTQSWLAACLVLMLAWRYGGRTYPDLIHAHADGQAESLLAGLWAGALFHRPLAMTIHCSRIGVYQPMSCIDNMTHNFVKRLEIKAIAKAKVVYYLTERSLKNAQEQLTACGIKKDVVSMVLPDTVHNANFYPADRPGGVSVNIRRDWHIPEDTPLLGFFGRIAHEKGWVSLVNILDAIRDQPWTLLVVGDGSQRGNFEKALRKKDLYDRVLITGFVSHFQVPQLMRAIKVLLMPSRHEELGGAAIEAMSCGIPVVCFAVGGLKETVGKVWPDLAVEPYDETAFARVLKKILRTDFCCSQAQREAGLTLAENYFNPEKVYTRLLESYKTAVME